MNRKTFRDLHRRARMDKRGLGFSPAPVWLDDINVWAFETGAPASVYRDGSAPRCMAAVWLGLCREAREVYRRDRWRRRLNHRANLTRTRHLIAEAAPLP